MESQTRQYFVAVSNNDLKLPTLIDLLNALLANGPFGVLVSCSSRDSLDRVVGGIGLSMPKAEVHALHADLTQEETDDVLQAFASRLQSADEMSSGQTETTDRNGRASAEADSSDVQSGTNSTAHTQQASDNSRGSQPAACVLALTDVMFKRVKPESLSSALPLLVNFDLPLRKDVYAEQASRHAQQSVGPQKITIYFVVAGQIASFRALEALVPSPIEVMPVHVSDIFSNTASATASM